MPSVYTILKCHDPGIQEERLVMAHLMVGGGFLVMTTTKGGDSLHAQACALGFTHVPWRGIPADLGCDTVL